MDQNALLHEASEHRPRLLSIAYRMLGSVAEAEDVVQEALLRYAGAAADEAIDSPPAYLTTVTTRLAIDTLRSARVRREQYAGTWLPEPVFTDGGDVAQAVELDEDVSLALLATLEALTPVERAVFILREAFDYGYDEIAAIVGKSEANCRQLAARARRRVDEGAPRFEADPERRDALAQRFFAACRDGDLEGLTALLADDVTLYGDGGGKAPAAPAPLHGSDRVGRMLVAIAKQSALAGISAVPRQVNGQPGAAFVDGDGRLVYVFALDVADGAVRAVRSIVNPDKLRHLGPLADLQALAQARSAARRTH